jgi:hypothetical protein
LILILAVRYGGRGSHAGTKISRTQWLLRPKRARS